jgi:hypothetical protein
MTAALAVAAVFAIYLRHDLDLSKNVYMEKIPDIFVESPDFTRVIKGKKWRVKAVDAESDSSSGMIKARSLDINIFETSTNRSSHINALQGTYSTNDEKMWFRDIDGIAFLGDRSVDFVASRADYDASIDVWFFSEGISASDDEIFVSGGVGKIEPSGVVSLGKGARVRWKIK